MAKIINVTFRGKRRGEWEVQPPELKQGEYKWSCNLCNASHLFTPEGPNEPYFPVDLVGKSLSGKPFKDEEIIICGTCIKDMESMLK